MDIKKQQAAVRELIRLMMDRTGLDATGLARSAGVVPSTLTRFLNKPVKHLLSARTLAKLSEFSGVPVPTGLPPATADEQKLLATFRSADQQGREMMLRLARSLESEPSPSAPDDKRGKARPPDPFARRESAKESASRADRKNVVPLRAMEPA